MTVADGDANMAQGLGAAAVEGEECCWALTQACGKGLRTLCAAILLAVGE